VENIFLGLRRNPHEKRHFINYGLNSNPLFMKTVKRKTAKAPVISAPQAESRQVT
jgi:hypothetical protein